MSKSARRLIIGISGASGVVYGVRMLELLKDTPVIYSYFYSYIAGTASNVKGYVPDGISVVNLRGVSLT